jgi:hypothetical protein
VAERYHAALALSEDRCVDFLREECLDDKALRRKV